MTEKTRKQIEAMKQQTIGVEIEMAKITREKACRTVAKFFGTEHTVYRNGNRWYCTDTLNRKWTVAYDSSMAHINTTCFMLRIVMSIVFLLSEAAASTAIGATTAAIRRAASTAAVARFACGTLLWSLVFVNVTYRPLHVCCE